MADNGYLGEKFIASERQKLEISRDFAKQANFRTGDSPNGKVPEKTASNVGVIDKILEQYK